MATVITSIGAKSATGDPVDGPLTMAVGGSGSGTPWTGTVNFSSAPTANIGDQLYYHQAYYNCTGPGSCSGPANMIYLITGISGDGLTLTVKYISGGANFDPNSLYATNNPSGSKVQPYILRFYSTPGTWNSDLENTGLYSSGDTAKGECYKDSALNQTSTIVLGNEGGNVGIAISILSVAEGQRHDGTAGSGYVINFTNTAYLSFSYDSDPGYDPTQKTVEWIDLNFGEVANGEHYAVYLSGGGAFEYTTSISHCLIHDFHHSSTDNTEMVYCNGQYSCVHNNIMYDLECEAKSAGIWLNKDEQLACNNTIYRIHSTETGASSNQSYGIYNANKNHLNISNNICVGITSTVADKHYDYYSAGGSSQARNNNLSEDSTADSYSASNGVTGVDPENLFMDSTVDGSEDLHLKNGAEALRAGADLGTSVTINSQVVVSSAFGTPINIDIDGRDRDAEGDDWDIGADQCHTCSEGGATANPAFIFFVD